MVLYTEEEILERVEGLINLMFDQLSYDDIQYQAYILKIMLYELFRDANNKHEQKIKSQYIL